MKPRRTVRTSQLLEGLENRRLMATFSVTNLLDSGTGSLRQAILNANAAAGPDTIAFNVPNVTTIGNIDPTSPMPEITGTTTIDATTQPGYVAGSPKIGLRGFNIANGNGLVFKGSATGSTLKGMVVSGWKRAVQADETMGNAVTFDTGMLGGRVEECTIGGPAGNQGNGILVRGSNTIIKSNTITLNRNGVVLDSASLTSIVGNKIDGNGNFQSGVRILNNSNNNLIGGSTAAEQNIINGNDVAGITIDSTIAGAIPTGNKIQGNIFGFTPSTNLGSGNLNGIRVLAGNNTLIGGLTLGEGNTFSHNIANHILLEGVTSTNTTVQGNFIGMKGDGTLVSGAMVTDAGVRVSDGATAVIGGTNANARNYITGADANSVGIGLNNGGFASIQNNVIGMALNGTPVGTLSAGISLSDAADGTIGGSGANEGNYIANATYQIRHSGGSVATIRGNFLGITPSGAMAAGAVGTGIYTNTGTVIVGGANPGDRNYFAGNSSGSSIGVDIIDTGSSVVKGNAFGFSPSGTPIGSMLSAINVTVASSSVIGGTNAGEGNAITNAAVGVKVESSGNVEILGNRFGLNLAGTANAGSITTGIYASDATTSTIRGNHFSVNTTGITGAMSGIIRGNVFGLAVDGLTPVTLLNGISVNAAGPLTIGGTGPTDGNLFSRPNGAGIAINVNEGSNTIVQGNRIGVTANGDVIPGARTGIGIKVGANNTQIGGTVAGAGNLVGRLSTGLSIVGGTGVKVEGNTLGLPNNELTTAVFIQGATNGTIGGATAAAGNVIYGGLAAVILDNASGNFTIRRNTLIASARPIDLGNDGLTANDGADADTGANTRQNFPLLLSADSNSGTSTVVTGLLSTTPSTPVIVDYYASDNASSAKTWLGSQTLITDAGGGVTLNASLPFVPGNQFITASATHLSNAPFGNTSEFAPGFQVSGPVDGVAPTVSNAAFEFETAQKVQLVFSEDLTASTVAADDLTMLNNTTGASFVPSSVSYDAATRTARFGFATILPDGNYSYSIAANKVTDLAGNGNAAFGGTTHVLAGDTDRNKVVNFNDLLVVAQNYGTTGKTFSQGDFNYDNNVDFNDLLMLAQRYGTNLFSQTPVAASAKTRVADGVLQ